MEKERGLVVASAPVISVQTPSGGSVPMKLMMMVMVMTLNTKAYNLKSEELESSEWNCHSFSGPVLCEQLLGTQLPQRFPSPGDDETKLPGQKSPLLQNHLAIAALRNVEQSCANISSFKRTNFSCMEAPTASPRLPTLPQVIWKF